MNHLVISITGGFIGGALTGVLNYLGLWITVKQLAGSRRPLLIVLFSMLLRLVGVTVIFYLLMGSHWERLPAILAGFFLVRTIVCRRLGRSQSSAIFH